MPHYSWLMWLITHQNKREITAITHWSLCHYWLITTQVTFWAPKIDYSLLITHYSVFHDCIGLRSLIISLLIYVIVSLLITHYSSTHYALMSSHPLQIQTWLLIAHCSLLIAHCSLLIAHCSLLIAHCSLLIAHWLITDYSLLIVFINHDSSLITHYSLLITASTHYL